MLLLMSMDKYKTKALEIARFYTKQLMHSIQHR